jgi:hypothetical protein
LHAGWVSACLRSERSYWSCPREAGAASDGWPSPSPSWRARSAILDVDTSMPFIAAGLRAGAIYGLAGFGLV